jgi:uridylate kinase
MPTSQQPETIVISLGGSLIFPGDDIDVKFLQHFREFILQRLEQDQRFILVTGGGMICRKYQKAVTDVAVVAEIDVNLLGISTVQINAHLLRLIFGEKAYSKTVDDHTVFSEEVLSFPIIIGGAALPGKSTDFNAVDFSGRIGSKRVVNLSNTNYVYDSDPKTSANAKKIEQITWDEYRALIPREFSPGLNTPFDPIASKLAQEQGTEVAIMNGTNLDNLKNYLDGKPFEGTVIVG